MPRALVIGTASVTLLYVLANVAYLLVLPIDAIKTAPADRVGSLMLQAIVPGAGSLLMSIAIMISTFGCINSLVLAGPRVFYSMANDKLFPAAAGKLNSAHVPGWSLNIQGVWASLLILPRTYDAATKTYGNLYGNLLDYVISAALIFYILTIAGVIRLRITRPEAVRPYRSWGYFILSFRLSCGNHLAWTIDCRLWAAGLLPDEEETQWIDVTFCKA
jgi:APA family basic amino acid/polyamine antiporter